MHRYSRMQLSPEAARKTLDTVHREGKFKLAEELALIAVIHHRKDYLEAGYSCMRDYCIGRLRMSRDEAYRGIQVAKAALRCPDVFECLADGRLSVTTASVLAPHLTPEAAAELLAAAAFRTRQEVVQMLAERSRPAASVSAAAAGEPLVESCSTSLAVPQVNSLADLCAPPEAGSAPRQHAAPHVENSRRGRVSPCVTGGYDVRMSITEGEHEDLRRAQALLGHAVPSGDPAEIYARAMKHYIAHLEKQRLGVKPGAAVPAGPGRGIPKQLRRLVWERHGAGCTFVSADGHRCEETGRLEIDHVTPAAPGGKTTPDNLRLLCAPHNTYEAERVLGKEHVEQRRELARRERARDRAAAEAGVARAQKRAEARTQARTRAPDAARSPARDAAHQARYDDIRAALRGLGYSDAEARPGAAMADAMPEASLEACVKLALTALTRAVVLRGERRARCTA